MLSELSNEKLGAASVPSNNLRDVFDIALVPPDIVTPAAAVNVPETAKVVPTVAEVVIATPPLNAALTAVIAPVELTFQFGVVRVPSLLTITCPVADDAPNVNLPS